MLLYAALGAVVLFFCVTTSPQAVARLLLHLAVWLPYHCGRHVASFLAPSFFWKSVQGEVVVLTGGAGGIGKLIATKFAAAGATLVLLDKSAELLDEARKAVEAAARPAGRPQQSRTTGCPLRASSVACRGMRSRILSSPSASTTFASLAR